MKLSRKEISIITDALAFKLHDIDNLLNTNRRLCEAREARNLYANDWRDRVTRLQHRRNGVAALLEKLATLKRE